MTEVKTIKGFLILLGILVVFISFRSFDRKKKIDTLEHSIDLIKNRHQFQINRKNYLISSQKQTIIDKNSKLAEAADTIQGLKDQAQRVKIVTVTTIKYDTIKIKQSQVVKDSSDYLLKLPFSFSKEHKWYGYGFTLDKEKVMLDSLYFNSDTEVVWGIEDKGVLKNIFTSNNPIVTIINNNPYTNTSGIENYTFKDFKPKRINFGLQAGYGITNSGLSPYFGIGINYNIIKR